MSDTNIHIFENTEAWDLAQAVKSQNVRKIKKIAARNPNLLDFQDPQYACTLLIWAVGMEKYKSAEALLKCGADPNIIADNVDIIKPFAEYALEKGDLSSYERISRLFRQHTALFIASSYSWTDSTARKDPKYVKLLLEYGADPNLCFTTGTNYFVLPDGSKDAYSAGIGKRPLIASIGCSIEKTKALVEAGADINHKTESGETAAIKALSRGGGAVTIDSRRYAHYLIVEKKAKVTEPYFLPQDYLLTQFPDDDDADTAYYPVDLLREWVCKLDSEDYKLKMEIVDEFARQGVDYWTTEIPQKELQEIQYMYPDTWDEYIKVY